MKVCCRCNEEKSLEDFYDQKDRKSGKQSMCKKCFNKYCGERWVKKKLKAIDYLGGKCQDCQKSYPYPIYDFHHLRDKDHQWNIMRKLSWDKIIKELDKCVLLCANCHRLKHHQAETSSK